MQNETIINGVAVEVRYCTDARECCDKCCFNAANNSLAGCRCLALVGGYGDSPIIVSACESRNTSPDRYAYFIKLKNQENGKDNQV